MIPPRRKVDCLRRHTWTATKRETPLNGSPEQLALESYYSIRAPEYDSVYAKPERQADLRAIEGWVARTFDGASVLELASGTGYWTRFLAPAASRVLATDASAEVLQIARSRAANARVEFLLADAYRLPLPDGRFDAAFAGFWFSHVPHSRIPAFLAELHRVLRPGARVVFLDNRFVPGNSTPIGDLDDEANTYQLRTVRDGSTFRVLKNFPTEHELRSAVAESAEAIRFHQWQYYWALEYTLTWTSP